MEHMSNSYSFFYIHIYIYYVNNIDECYEKNNLSRCWDSMSPSFQYTEALDVAYVKTNSHLTPFQMLTLLQIYLYRQSQCSRTWDSKCLALIAQ